MAQKPVKDKEPIMWDLPLPVMSGNGHGWRKLSLTWWAFCMVKPRDLPNKLQYMEILVLLVIWAITVPICIRSAKKIKSNVVVAVLVGMFIPILGTIIYAFLAAKHKVSA